MKPLKEIKHPIHGYVLKLTPAVQTDIRKTFKRVIAQQKQQTAQAAK